MNKKKVKIQFFYVWASEIAFPHFIPKKIYIIVYEFIKKERKRFFMSKTRDMLMLGNNIRNTVGEIFSPACEMAKKCNYTFRRTFRI